MRSDAVGRRRISPVNASAPSAHGLGDDPLRPGDGRDGSAAGQALPDQHSILVGAWARHDGHPCEASGRGLRVWQPQPRRDNLCRSYIGGAFGPSAWSALLPRSQFSDGRLQRLAFQNCIAADRDAFRMPRAVLLAGCGIRECTRDVGLHQHARRSVGRCPMQQVTNRYRASHRRLLVRRAPHS
jgi:hypothetical protein